MAEKITIIGCGPGGSDYLTPIARKAALQMDVLAGAARLFDLFPEFIGEKIFYKGTAKMLDDIAEETGKIGVLVSGDPSYFSLAESIIKRFGTKNCQVITGISSIQVALSRFGLKANTARIISSHAGIPSVSPDSVKHEESIVLLGGNPDTVDWILELIELTRDTHTLHACSDLTLDTESITHINTTDSESLTDHLTPSRLILVFSRCS